MPKKAAKKADEPAPEAVAAAAWECPECAQENEADDATCVACEFERPGGAAAQDEDDKFKGFCVGLITALEDVAGKDKLRELEVDVGGPASLKIVTNAPNVAVGARVVVATVGALVNDVAVKKASVGGVVSEGMLCDAPMLGWTGGGAGNAALVPDSFSPGDKPPPRRPRMDGK